MIRIQRRPTQKDVFFIDKPGQGAPGMYVTTSQAHVLFERLGELLGRTFGADSASELPGDVQVKP